MGCPSEVDIGSNLVFSVTTHDPDTGVLSDADSVPVYRVYEDETATPILTGSMSKLDDSNTTGFYTEQIACSVANGFENNKTYTIYIEATVDSDKGAIPYSFKAKTSVGGVGSSSCTLTVTDGTNPVENVEVWITTDSAGTNIIGGTLYTNSSGQVTFMLDSGGTYYIWKQKDGYNFTNPETWTV